MLPQKRLLSVKAYLSETPDALRQKAIVLTEV
jgi:hypothetical protein